MSNEEVIAQARAIASEVEAAGFSKPPELVQVSGNWYRIDSLDAAWAEAEAALPEGWAVHMLRLLRVPYRRDPFWQAVAGFVGGSQASGEGDTPAAALRALAAKLRERAG